MRNPFTNIIKYTKNWIVKKLKRTSTEKDSKVETGRSSSGGGGKSKVVSHVTKKEIKNINTNTYYNYLISNGKSLCEARHFINRKNKNRTKNKMAKKSRRINRLKAA